jgi:hypothetical protein
MREESGLLGFSHVFGHSVAAESDAAQGGSLEMISDASLDFVFSFDVFVHIKREIVEEYLSELGIACPGLNDRNLEAMNQPRWYGTRTLCARRKSLGDDREVDRERPLPSDRMYLSRSGSCRRNSRSLKCTSVVTV